MSGWVSVRNPSDPIYFFDPRVRTTSQQYVISVYYAILMVLGNEMGPKTLTQTMVASSCFILGALIMAFIFGSIAAAMTGANQKDSRAQERLDFLQHTMAQIALPVPTQNEVLSYMDQINEAPKVQPDMARFLHLLSPALRSSVLSYIHQDLIDQIPYFKVAEAAEISFLVSSMKTSL